MTEYSVVGETEATDGVYSAGASILRNDVKDKPSGFAPGGEPDDWLQAEGTVKEVFLLQESSDAFES